MIRGESIYLTELDPANAQTARAWINDPDVHAWMLTGHVPVTQAAEEAFYAEIEASASDFGFEIHTADGGRYIGNCGLHGVSTVDRDGELGIFIGDPAQHGKGYGRDALITLCRFAFHTLGMNSLWLRAVEGNERAIALYRSIGFRDAGVRREARYAHGRFWDVLAFDMLRSEFDELYGVGVPGESARTAL